VDIKERVQAYLSSPLPWGQMNNGLDKVPEFIVRDMRAAYPYFNGNLACMAKLREHRKRQMENDRKYGVVYDVAPENGEVQNDFQGT
jgi:hypothetical protein